MSTRMYGPGDDRHGTLNGYTHLGCRCEKCKGVAQASYRDTVARGMDPDDERHGTRLGYISQGCRCPECTEAVNAYAATPVQCPDCGKSLRQGSLSRHRRTIHTHEGRA